MPRSDALGFKGDLLCADFNLRRVSRHKLSRSRSSYMVETDTFLESDQTDFHPTDVIEDADGSLLVADTGSWYHICCPTSKLSKPRILGAIYRIQKTDATAPVDPRGHKLDWDKPSIRYLSDKRPIVVRRAIEALAKEENVDALRTVKASLPATWALHRIPGTAARKAIRERLIAGTSDVRAAAIHSIGLWRDARAVAELIDTDPHTGIEPAIKFRNTSIFNNTRQPSISLPNGFDDNGLPTGLMITTAKGTDNLTLRIGHNFQLDTDFHLQRPSA